MKPLQVGLFQPASQTFARAPGVLETMWTERATHPEVALKRQLWDNLLRVVYRIEEYRLGGYAASLGTMKCSLTQRSANPRDSDRMAWHRTLSGGAWVPGLR